MATKKETKTAKPASKKKAAPKKDPNKAFCRGQEYTVLSRNEHRTELTDGVIHFWARNEDVTY